MTIPKPATDPRGYPIVGRTITEVGGKGGAGDRDRRRVRLTPDYIKAELSRRVDAMAKAGTVDFEHEEFTPITTIAVVRAELKDDISDVRREQKDGFAEMRNAMTTIRTEMSQLFGAIKANNEMMPNLVDQLMAMIGNVVTTRQHIDTVTTESKLGTEKDREKTASEIAITSNKEKWINIGKIVAFIASGAGATLILNAITSC